MPPECLFGQYPTGAFPGQQEVGRLRTEVVGGSVGTPESNQ